MSFARVKLTEHMDLEQVHHASLEGFKQYRSVVFLTVADLAKMHFKMDDVSKLEKLLREQDVDCTVAVVTDFDALYPLAMFVGISSHATWVAYTDFIRDLNRKRDKLPHQILQLLEAMENGKSQLRGEILYDNPGMQLLD